ncbi:MAG TPA: CoA transferase [Myxococcota bacterium]|jgi:crotonobetainyl-CoA:carnitine CoA-transferase CaiB-like acyl-CoA transferase|nr:CoA transferase [Myxococcota bacterium]
MKAPLEGMRVIEAASFVAVPAAGALLGDLGAEVIKVEVPRGEVFRRSRLKYAGYSSEFSEWPAFLMDNRGKRSLPLDLTDPAACDALVRLVGTADIFVTNLLPGRRRKYGLDHETLLARYPRLIVGAISGYGLAGDEADRPAFDYAAYWARTGMMDAMRDEGVPPSLLRPGIGDHAAATNLVCGILSALRLRDADGRGRFVDVSLLETGFHALGNDLATALVTGEPPKRHDRRAPPNPLWNSYPVADGRWILLVMVEPERYWPGLCRAIDRKDLLDDPRFAEPFTRARHGAELTRILEQAFAARPLEVWRPILDAAGLIWSPVQRLDEAIRDPQAEALGCFQPVEHPKAGSYRTMTAPFRIDGAPAVAARPPSELGADAKTLLREVGIDEAEIERLTLDPRRAKEAK